MVMLQRLVRRFRLFGALLAAAACTHQYTPNKYPIDPNASAIASFANAPSVQLVNAGKPGETLIASQGIHEWYGDYHAWTDVAISLTADELAKRSVHVAADGSKVLKLDVPHANVIYGFAAIRCILTLRVETGAGATFTFEGNNVSPLTIYRAMDGSVTRAVQAMLESPQIRAYLEGR